MTNKEAIANLNHIYGIMSSDIQRSLDIAIKALEERPQDDYDEGYKTGYTDALLEVEELCQRKKKLFGADMRGGGEDG